MSKTKVQLFTEIKAVIDSTKLSNKTELIDFIDKQIGSLIHKSENRKPTSKQLENEAAKAEIIAILERAETPLTISQIKAGSEMFAEWEGTQRMSALLRQLGEKGTRQVEKILEKRVTYFFLSSENEE